MRRSRLWTSLACVGALTAATLGVIVPTSSSLPSAGADPTTTLPAGVTLTAIDGGTSYFSQWTNGFPDSIFPIGVFPAESAPADLKAMGINFFTPMRNDTAGTWSPVYQCAGTPDPCVNDQTTVNATTGFYSGADYEGTGSPAWGSRAAFNVFGDELDGNCSNQFNNNPSNVSTQLSHCGTWGGTTAAGLEAANAATLTNDPSRPVYDQFTTTLMDAPNNFHYTVAQKQAICASADIFSFDIYPLVKRGGNVYDMYDQVNEARGYCGDAVPVMPFVEQDTMDCQLPVTTCIYPSGAQIKAEVWNAIIAGARGIQYFDQYGTITDSTYTSGGHFVAGSVHNSIDGNDQRVVNLTPEILSPTANGYVTATGSMSVMAKDDAGHMWVFAAPHAQGSQTPTFTIAGGGTATVTVYGESRTVAMTGGTFTDNFANANAVHIYEIS